MSTPSFLHKGLICSVLLWFTVHWTNCMHVGLVVIIVDVYIYTVYRIWTLY